MRGLMEKRRGAVDGVEALLLRLTDGVRVEHADRDVDVVLVRVQAGHVARLRRHGHVDHLSKVGVR